MSGSQPSPGSTEGAEQRSSYRQIMKATSLFGGVQVFNILITIIRSKAVALLLGPEGMGIGGLYDATQKLMTDLTGLGLATSAVKDIAAAQATGDAQQVATTVTVFRRLVWFTGMAGLILTLVLAPYLSELSFGDRSHTMGFVWISSTLLMAQIGAGQMVLLQGLRRLKELALAGMIGSSIGLLVALSLYWLYGLDGIVPAIVTSGATSLLVALWFGRKVRIAPTRVDLRATLGVARGMVSMGVVIALNGVLLTGAAYILRIFISWAGSIGDVGLYSAGFSIVNTYVGMVFTAMLTDYYPRLSAVADDPVACNRTINQQADIALLILGPIVLAFLVFIQVAVWVLYSEKFLVIDQMMYWASLGVLFKGASWPVGFVFVPKGDSRLFITSELVANIYMLLLNMGGYYWFGLQGLGISFLVSYMLYLAQVLLIARHKYGFRFHPPFVRLFAIQGSLAVLCFLVVMIFHGAVTYAAGAVLTGLSSWYSYRELDKRIDVKAAVRSVLARLRRR